MVNASASQARGLRFESRWEHSSFLLKSSDFVPVAPRVAFSGMAQVRIENNLFIYDSVLVKYVKFALQARLRKHLDLDLPQDRN